MNINQEGIDLIKSFEGFRSKMYKDAVGLPTIGYGTLIDTKEEEWLKTAVITESKGEELLRKDVDRFVKAVNKMIISILNENQFSALVSFTYNCGEYNLKTSTLLKKVNINPNDSTIRNEFNKWVNAGGKKLPGLIRRRTAEADLYFK